VRPSPKVLNRQILLILFSDTSGPARRTSGGRILYRLNLGRGGRSSIQQLGKADYALDSILRTNNIQ
jgi:hypothetical protein